MSDTLEKFDRLLNNTEIKVGSNCGTGSGGFKPGNTCSSGGSQSKLTTKDEAAWSDYATAMLVKSVSKGEKLTPGDIDANGNEITKKDIAEAKRLSSKIQASASTSNTGFKEVYRGVLLDEETDVKKMFSVGKTHTFDSLTAVSKDKTIAEKYTDLDQFSGGLDLHRVLFHIKDENGVKGVTLGEGSEFGSGNESILPTGASYKITGYKKENNLHVVSLSPTDVVEQTKVNTPKPVKDSIDPHKALLKLSPIEAVRKLASELGTKDGTKIMEVLGNLHGSDGVKIFSLITPKQAESFLTNNALEKFDELIINMAPNQPRVPAGSSNGGQWESPSSSSVRARLTKVFGSKASKADIDEMVQASARGETTYGQALKHSHDVVKEYTQHVFPYENAFEGVNERGKKLQEILLSHELKQDETLFRGVNKQHAVELSNLKVGDIFSAGGTFTSTSLSKNIPTVFAQEGEHPTIIQIQAPKGTKGAFVEENASEILLPAYTQMRLVSKTNGLVFEIVNQPSLTNNMAPNQPRDKNGRWSKTNSGVFHTVAPSGGKAKFKLDDPVGLVAYFQMKSKTKITPMNLKKLEALNPQGLNSGKVVVPQGNKELAELAKRVMPKGTQITSKYINNEHVKAYEAQKKSGVPASPTPVSIPTSTPTPAPTGPYTTHGDPIGGFVSIKHEGKTIGSASQQGPNKWKAEYNGKTLLSAAANHHLAIEAIKEAHLDETAPPLGMGGTPTPQKSSSNAGKGLRSLPTIDASTLTHEGHLGGTTGATLVKDGNGKKFVLKKQNNMLGDPQGFINNEIHADTAYRAAGIPVPHSGAAEYSLIANKPIAKYSQFLEGGQTLNQWYSGKSQNEIDKMHKEIGKNFVMDALLSNRDVIGQNYDNIMIHKGVPLRVDNGGSFDFRAQGMKKTFDGQVTDLESMRNASINPQAAKVFGHLTDNDVKAQIKEVLSKKDEIMKAVPPHLVNTMEERFKYLETWKQTPGIPLNATINPPSVGASTIPVSTTLQTQPSALPFGGLGKIGNSPDKPAFQVVPGSSLIQKGGIHTYKTETPEPTKKLQEWVATLSDAEKLSIQAYTLNAYGSMREAVAKGDTTNKFTKKSGESFTINDFNSAIAKAPGLDQPSVVYRGIKKKSSSDTFVDDVIRGVKQAGVGAIITENAHQSLTRDPDWAFTSGADSVLFRIVSKTAKHIHHDEVHSNYGEKELLGMPGVQYRVTKIIEEPDSLNGSLKKHTPKLIVHMEEI